MKQVNKKNSLLKSLQADKQNGDCSRLKHIPGSATAKAQLIKWRKQQKKSKGKLWQLLRSMKDEEILFTDNRTLIFELIKSRITEQPFESLL